MCTLAYYNSAVTTRTAMRDVPPCPCADKRALVAGAAVIWGSTTNTQIRELRSLLIAVQGIVFASALVPKYRPRTATSHGGGSRHSFNFHNIANRGPAPGPRRYGGSGVRRIAKAPQLTATSVIGVFYDLSNFYQTNLNSHITHLPTLAQDRCPTYPGLPHRLWRAQTSPSEGGCCGASSRATCHIRATCCAARASPRALVYIAPPSSCHMLHVSSRAPPSDVNVEREAEVGGADSLREPVGAEQVGALIGHH